MSGATQAPLDPALLALLRETAREWGPEDFAPDARIADSVLDSLEVMEVVAALELTPEIERELFDVQHSGWHAVTFGDLDGMWRRSRAQRGAAPVGGGA